MITIIDEDYKELSDNKFMFIHKICLSVSMPSLYCWTTLDWLHTLKHNKTINKWEYDFFLSTISK